MRPKERRDSGQNDLFRARLDQTVDIDHPLAKLGRAIAWRLLEERMGAVYSDKAGHPPLPTRLMAGLSIKHMHNLSDEDLCARWIENPYYQLFCGEEFFRHKLTFDRSSLTRWRQRMGKEKLVALIQESLTVATRSSTNPDFSDISIDRFCEKLLIDHGQSGEAYRRYGLRAVSGTTNLSVYRSLVRTYPDRDHRRMLLDLIETREDKGKWFAAAKEFRVFRHRCRMCRRARRRPIDAGPSSPRFLRQGAEIRRHRRAACALEPSRLAGAMTQACRKSTTP